MKISINSLSVDGPYGGANQFANMLEKELVKRGHSVTRKLEPCLDIILATISQSESSLCSYDYYKMVAYKKAYPNVKIVHRINTCDEQRGENLGINMAVMKMNSISDCTVFVSKFIRNFYHNLYGINKIILNGIDESIFNSYNRVLPSDNEPLQIVTHHWSTNPFKGHAIYQILDDMLHTPIGHLFNFTYIGRVPDSSRLTNVIPPICGQQLANELKTRHIYITASLLESGPNHPLEAMACGLPVLYIDSGSMEEYCGQWGMEFNQSNLKEKLIEMHENYKTYIEKIKTFNLTGQHTAMQYLELFQSIL